MTVGNRYDRRAKASGRWLPPRHGSERVSELAVASHSFGLIPSCPRRFGPFVLWFVPMEPVEKAPFTGTGLQSGVDGIIRSAQVFTQGIEPGAMPQPAQGLFLDLPHTLSRELEVFANLLQGQRTIAIEAEIQLDDLGFTRLQGL